MKPCLNGATTMPYSLEEDVREASKAGFGAIEVWWEKAEKFLETHTTEELNSLFVEYSMQPAAICPLMIWPFRDTAPARETYRRAVSVAPKIGCDTLIACPDFQPARMTRQEAMAVHAEELQSMANMANDHGLRLAIEPIGGHTLVPGPKEALELIEMAGSPANVGVLMDTFHYFRSQIPEEEIRAIPLEKLFMVHVNDCEDRPLNELTDANRLYPKEGVIPLDLYLSILNEMGYQGYLSVEIFRPEYWERPIESIMRDAYDYLSKMFTY